MKATTVGDDNPRRSRTKNLIGTLVATALLVGALEALAPASAPAMRYEMTEKECFYHFGTWTWDQNEEYCEVNIGGVDGGSGGGGSGGGGSGGGGSDDSGGSGGGRPGGGSGSQEGPGSDSGTGGSGELSLQEIEELMRDPSLLPDAYEYFKNLLYDKYYKLPPNPQRPNELYRQDPNIKYPDETGDDNVFDPDNFPKPGPIVTARLESKPKKHPFKKKVRKGKARSEKARG